MKNTSIQKALILIFLCGFLCISILAASDEKTAEQPKVTLSAIQIKDVSTDGDLNVLKRYIESGGSINIKFENNKTPLFFAIENGHDEIADYLIENGANIKLTLDPNKQTPLHFAARFGRTNIIKKLLQKDVDVNAKDFAARTPIFYAILRGHKEAAELLIEKGADTNLKDSDGDNLIVIAGTNFHTEFIPFLKSKGITYTIFEAAAIGNLDDIKTMLKEDPKLINAQDELQNTPLQCAAVKGQMETVEYLLNNGADINTKNKWGTTPLHRAAISGKKDVVEFLIKKGLSPDVTDNNGNTPLYRVVTRNMPEMAAFLIKLGADPDKESGSESPKQYVMRAGSPDLMSALGLTVTSIETSMMPGQATDTPPVLSFKKGENLESFKAKTIDDKEIKSDDFESKKLLIIFWATYFEESGSALKKLNEIISASKNKDLAVLGISLDFEKDSIDSFVKENNIAFPQICREDEANSTLAKKFKTDKIPLIIYVEKMKIKEINPTMSEIKDLIK